MFRISTSAESAAAFRASYERRMEALAAGNRRRAAIPRKWRNAEIAAFRELVLSKVSRLTPKHRMQLHVDVDEEWGSVHIRRVERALRWLLDRGAIERTADGYLLARRARRAA